MARKKAGRSASRRSVRSRKPERRKAASPRRGPAPIPAGKPAAEGPDHSRARAVAIAEAGLGKKAEKVTVLDVRGLTGYADYFVIMTAESEPQASAIADAVDERLDAMGATRLGVEGHSAGRWVLIDYGDVVAHVFNPEARMFYDLEGLWADAPRVAVQG
jgi:ribosome-associated protein